jgi:phospho-N-acetylmuramoyl-pentapeptide-transferase
MFPYFSGFFATYWGPFRLLGSHLVLIGMGSCLAALVTWRLLPGLCHLLPRDRGRAFTPGAEAARGKPTGVGLIVMLLLLPALGLFLPPSAKLWEIIGCLMLACITGYLDDHSQTPWGELLKGSLDLLVAVLTAWALCQGETTTIWLPLLKNSFSVSPFVFILIAAPLLWLSINATNCSDGVDGLAGSLSLLSLFYLGGFLYIVIGHREMAEYLLVPHNPEGARWAVLLFTTAGALAGYLWHNASPSSLLMGDAGSRVLGLLIGVAVLAAGNPFLIVVVAPVILANGGTGLMKVILLRFFRRLGFDVKPPGKNALPATGGLNRPINHVLIRMLHRVRFPLHDHCRQNLGWSEAQVLLRFVLLQTFLTPLLLGLLVKLR